MALLTKVGMIILMEHNLEEAVVFYQKLGLTMKFHLKDRWAEFALSNMKIGLCPSSESQENKITGVVFEVDDLKAFYEQHKQSINFQGQPIEKIHGIMISFKDPSGNVLDLYQPTPEKVKHLAHQAQESEGQDCCQSNQKCCKAEA